MPQQIDPTTGLPVGFNGGDLEGGAPPQFIEGLPGLTQARLAQEGEQPGAFQYFRSQNGQRYIQDARTDPTDGQGAAPPPGIGGGGSGIGAAPGVGGGPGVVPTSPLPGQRPGMGGGPSYSPGIGGFGSLQTMLLPFLMAMMRPGIGGYPNGGQGGGGGYGARQVQPMPSRFAPQPTGGIARGTFSF